MGGEENTGAPGVSHAGTAPPADESESASEATEVSGSDNQSWISWFCSLRVRFLSGFFPSFLQLQSEKKVEKRKRDRHVG